jgi:hypothetical protein
MTNLLILMACTLVMAEMAHIDDMSEDNKEVDDILGW